MQKVRIYTSLNLRMSLSSVTQCPYKCLVELRMNGEAWDLLHEPACPKYVPAFSFGIFWKKMVTSARLYSRDFSSFSYQTSWAGCLGLGCFLFYFVCFLGGFGTVSYSPCWPFLNQWLPWTPNPPESLNKYQDCQHVPPCPAQQCSQYSFVS